MSSFEELVAAAVAASASKQDEALRLLRGQPSAVEPYLGLRALAQATGFSVSTLRRWQVPSHAFGGGRRYRRSEVEAYLRSPEFSRRLAALRAERRKELGRTNRRAVL